MIRAEIRLDLPGGARTVGHLLDDDRRIHFEYAADFLGTGLQLSPFKLPLGTGGHAPRWSWRSDRRTG